MNKLIFFPLMIIFLTSTFNQILAYSLVDYSYNETISQPITGSQTLGENTTTIEFENVEGVFNINMVAGIVALIIGLTAVAIGAGIKVLGSGIDSTSINIVYKSIAYYGIWGIFSALSFSFFYFIPIFGLCFWIGLTLIYTIGFLQTFEGM